jgi:hypothetical protein
LPAVSSAASSSLSLLLLLSSPSPSELVSPATPSSSGSRRSAASNDFSHTFSCHG